MRGRPCQGYRTTGTDLDFQSPLTTGKPASCEQSLDRLCRIAVREYVGGQHLILDTEMVLEQALEHGAQIGRRFQIAVLVEIGLLDARPIGDDPATLSAPLAQSIRQIRAVPSPDAVSTRRPSGLNVATITS